MANKSDTLNGALFQTYRMATQLAAPLLRIMLRRRIGKGREIAARLPERWGQETAIRPIGTLIWLHAASVGETICVLPLITRLAPQTAILVTTGTVTSAQLLARWLAEQGLESTVAHRFVPLDVPRWVARFLDHWRPDAALFVESELWPNMLSACRRRGIGLALLNARMSSRSAAGWRRVPGLARRIVCSFDWIQARSEEDAARWRGLGADNLILTGDLKLAAPPLSVDKAELARLSVLLAGRPRWLAASTHQGEEAIIAQAHQLLLADWPDLLTIIVPRHPVRGVALQAAHGWPRRETGNDPAPDTGIWIADTIGELGLWYRLCPIVLIGKSLLPPGGGQNPLEPARLGCALAAGPLMGNFSQATAALHHVGGLHTVADASQIAEWVGALLADPAILAKTGAAAQSVATGAEQLLDSLTSSIHILRQKT